MDDDDEVQSLAKGLSLYTSMAKGLPLSKKQDDRSILRDKINDLVSWLDKYNGNVDHDVFVRNCGAIFNHAVRISNIREPLMVNPFARLDFTCSVIGLDVLTIAWDYGSLPGAAEFRAFIEDNSF